MVISVDSEIYKYFHEAGHIETALLYGATVTSVKIKSNGSALASITHKKDLSSKVPIACGGYAVEKILYDNGSIVDTKGNPLSSDAFEQQAMTNARLDKYPFYLKQPVDSSGIYPGAQFQPNPDNSWPQESDEPFRTYTMRNIVPMLYPRMAVIAALAAELELHESLSMAQIEQIRAC